MIRLFFLVMFVWLFLVGILASCGPTSERPPCVQSADCAAPAQCISGRCERLYEHSPDTRELPDASPDVSEPTPEPSREEVTSEPIIPESQVDQADATPRLQVCDATHPCAGKMLCHAGLCTYSCAKDTDCTGGVGDTCVSTPEGSHCQRTCDIRLGRGTNPLCPLGTYCFGYCKASPPVQMGPRKQGQSCDDAEPQGRCDGIGARLFCFRNEEAGTSACAKACDPRQGERNNPDCAENQHCLEESASFRQGRCAAAPQQAEGDWCDGHFLRCKDAMVCYLRQCHKPCSHLRGRYDNPDCASPSKTSYVCTPLGSLQDSKGVCQRTCEASTGLADCPVGSACLGGVCMPASSPSLGDLQEGARCSRTLRSLRCDGSKGLFCDESAEVLVPVCVRACDLRKGTLLNLECGQDESCIADGQSPRQGQCIPPYSQGPGERCNAKALRCASGLHCVASHCHQACDREKGAQENPDCQSLLPQGGDCVSEWDLTLQSRVDVCRKRCDLSKGTVPHPDCPVGSYCDKNAGSTQKGVGLCVYSKGLQTGTRTAGQACLTSGDLSQRCDGPSGLFCRLPEYTCFRACDPHNQSSPHPDCSAQERCYPDAQSYLQGRCVALGARKYTQPCNTNYTCETGLFCRRDEGCSIPCTTAKGTSGNLTCPKGTYCNDIHTYTEHPAFCDPLPAPKQGPKQQGKSCLLFDATQLCDAAKGLICDPGSFVCVAGCDPKDGLFGNKACPSGYECFESPQFSHLGGYCVVASQAEFQPCDQNKRCQVGLRCHEGICQYQCDLAKGLLSNADCDARGKGYGCFDVFGGLGICRFLCDRKQAALANPACPASMYCANHNNPGVKGSCQLPPVTPKGTSNIGELCRTSRASQGGCLQGLTCVDDRCWPLCDPNQPLLPSHTCATGSSCVSHGLVYSGGICLPTPARKEGESCDHSGQRCGADLICEHVCHKRCDVSKGRTNNPICGATSMCETVVQQGLCRKPCDHLQGPLAGCAVGTFCTAPAPGQGTCQAAPVLIAGLGKRYDRCQTRGLIEGCDGTKKLFCHTELGQGLCALACDPRKGEQNNPGCAAGESCVIALDSPLQGRCRPAATRKLGERCDNSTNLCVQGQLCFQGQCHLTCDLTLGKLQNPACANLPKAGECISIGAGLSVCQVLCDPRQSSFANPNCATGQQCLSVTAIPPHTAGRCWPLPPPEQGTRGKGERCEQNIPCDGSQGLVCVQFNCYEVCDPHKGNADCPSGETCSGYQGSYNGGYCIK